MKSSESIPANDKLPLQTKPPQPKWQRIILLCVLGYEGAGAILGGSLLVAVPDGSLMKMPVDIMHGAFPDFMLPGIILFLLGILNLLAFSAVFRRTSSQWIWAISASVAMITWFWVEIAILLDLHWLHAMWGLPVLVGLLAAFSLVPVPYRTTLLLYCGVLSSLLYAAINVIVPLQWEAYSEASQTISELSAIGAPTRTLWNVMAMPYTVLTLAFAWGMYKAAGNNRRLRIAGTLMIVYGMLGFFWPFAPMHLREVLANGGSTFSDTMHLALGAVTEVIYLVALAFAAAAFGKGFRLYSILTFFLVLVFGVLTFLEAPNIGRGEPTPLIGVWERINIGLFLLWITALSIAMIHTLPPSSMQGNNIKLRQRGAVPQSRSLRPFSLNK